MHLQFHTQGTHRIAEITADTVILHTVQEALDLLMEAKMEDADRMIMHQKNISPDFFDLKTKLAGDVLQKYLNYGMQLAVVGNFEQIKSESFRAFVIESHRSRQIFFVETVQEALGALAK